MSRKIKSLLVKSLLWIIGIIGILACVAVSWWFTFNTDQGLTYWASTIGTAIGGMAAVVVAVYLWHLDSRAGRRQAEIHSNAKTVEVILNCTQKMKSIIDKGSVYDEIGYPWVKEDVAAVITEQVAEITSALIWMRDEQARTDLLEVLPYLSANSDFLMLGPEVRYATTVRDISKWLEQLCYDLLHLENKREKLKHRAEYAGASIDLQEKYAKEDRMNEEEWKRLKDNFAEQDKQAMQEQLISRGIVRPPSS